MYPGTNLLAKKKQKQLHFKVEELVPLTKDQMMKGLEIKSWDGFDGFWKELKTVGAVKRVAVDGKVFWAINPCYCNSCKYIPYWLYVAFKADMDRYLNNKTRLRYGEIAMANNCYVNNLEDLI